MTNTPPKQMFHDDQHPELSVVIPVHNEEENLEPLCLELVEVLERTVRRYEVIIVDDGSQDRSVEILRRVCSRDPSIRVIRLSRNFGQTAALQAGFDAASGNIVVTMDGDLQNDPADIGSLIKVIEQGADIASGWRKDRQDKWLTRKLPSMIANRLIAVLTGVPIHDNGCSLRAYRMEVVKRASLYAEMHRFLVPMLSLSGCRIDELVVNHRARRFGLSKYGLSRIWKVLLDLLTIKMLLRFVSHPAAWFVVLAFPFFLAAILAGAISGFAYATSNPSSDLALVMPSVALLSAFVVADLIVLGLVAELIVQAGDYRESDPVLYQLVRPERPT